MSLKNTALNEAVVSNQQLFRQRGNPLCTRWLYFKIWFCAMGWERYQSAQQVRKPSKVGHLIDHLA